MRIQEILRNQGYCCCGEDDGKPIMATLCPKHGSTVLNCGNELEYPLNDEQSDDHFAATGCKCRGKHGDRPECPKHGILQKEYLINLPQVQGLVKQVNDLQSENEKFRNALVAVKLQLSTHYENNGGNNGVSMAYRYAYAALHPTHID